MGDCSTCKHKEADEFDDPCRSCRYDSCSNFEPIPSAEPLFYVQDSRERIGNDVLWWGKDSCGYTCDLDKAGLYPASFKMRDTDILWPKEVIDALAERHVSTLPPRNWEKK